jgi:hypothetical protein
VIRIIIHCHLAEIAAAYVVLKGGTGAGDTLRLVKREWTLVTAAQAGETLAHISAKAKPT